MTDTIERYESLLKRGADRLKGHERRLFMAEVTHELFGGRARLAERRFGWGRKTVETGMHELRTGIRCLENFRAKGGRRVEDRNPQLAADIRQIVDPNAHADPELKSGRRYSNLTSAEVLEALVTQKGYAKEDLPKARCMRDILNRMNYRLKRVQKGRPIKKIPQTDEIFANVAAAKEAAKTDPEVLEISMDTKAKVNEGDYARGGKNPDGRGRESDPRVGP